MNRPSHLFAVHERRFAENRFVYPVLSRRSRGLSIGVNLNPDKVCNFDCIYCQVDRTTRSETRFVEIDRLLDELDHALTVCLSGEIFSTEKFRGVAEPWRRVNDIAFSGDGEPTTYRNFDEIIAACAERKEAHGAREVKMVLITNASMFHRPHVQRGLELLDRHQGEIWAKLDAGTPEYFALVDRTGIPFQRILDNLLAAARQRPLVIQSLFMRVHGEPPAWREIDAYCGRLDHIVKSGGKIDYVQVYTIARRPAESYVRGLSNDEVDAICDRVRAATGLSALPFYGIEHDGPSPSSSPSEIEP